MNEPLCSVFPLKDTPTGRLDTNTNYDDAEHIYKCPQGTKEKIVTKSEITYSW